ncbi:MAG: small multi-drug export protein [Eubacteriales bacterium]|nr:small multi-drug export protein [Eubacteriales bacterium]
MGEIVAKFIVKLFGGNSILGTMFLAMLPITELKVAIPMGMSESIWGSSALPTWQAFLWALLGSCLVVPVVALLFRPIYNWMKDKKFFKTIVDFLVGDITKRSEKIKAENQGKTARRTLWLKILAVFLFVAFPVPLTGVWTGTCFAVLLGLNFWVICAAVIAGNVLCGGIVTLACNAFPQITDILLIVFLLLILAAIITKVILHVLKKRRAIVTTENATLETDPEANK